MYGVSVLYGVDAAAVAAIEGAATPLHHGGRQTGRQVAKYATKMVAKNS